MQIIYQSGLARKSLLARNDAVDAISLTDTPASRYRPAPGLEHDAGFGAILPPGDSRNDRTIFLVRRKWSGMAAPMARQTLLAQYRFEKPFAGGTAPDFYMILTEPSASIIARNSCFRFNIGLILMIHRFLNYVKTIRPQSCYFLPHFLGSSRKLLRHTRCYRSASGSAQSNR